MACRAAWADRRLPESRRGVAHADGAPMHHCKLDRGHAAKAHQCSCGAQTTVAHGEGAPR